jgi:hypothetical protein
MRSWGVLVLFLITLPRSAAAQSAGALRLPRYETRFFTVYTDLPPEYAREAALRMTAMAEEYQKRTSDFAGQIKSRMPFFLHADRDAYISNGGMEDTAGYFDGSKQAGPAHVEHGSTRGVSSVRAQSNGPDDAGVGR